MNNKIKSLLILMSIILLSGCSSSQKETQLEDQNLETETVEESENESTLETVEETEIESESEQETETESESESEVETESESVSETSNEDIKSLKTSDYIELLNEVNVYRSAEDAHNKNNRVDSYSAGNFYIYKITDLAINITRNEGNPGGWVNFDELNYKLLEKGSEDVNQTEETISETQAEENNSSSSNVESKSWSWAYPDTSNYMSENNAIYKVPGSNSLYLTFDNGYEYDNLTSDILDVLKKNNVKAVFFTTSDYLRDNPSLSQRIIYDGHNLANHTHKHLHQGEVSKNQVIEDIKGWEQTYRNVLGLQPNTSLMRPPAGSYNVNSLQAAKELGYKTVFWNYAYADWEPQNQPDPKSSLQKLLDNNEGGSIILLHSVSQTNADILDEYIRQSKAQGYNFELLK